MSAWGHGWITDLPALSRWSWPSILRTKRALRIAVATSIGVVAIIAITLELRNSWLESLVFQTPNQHLTYRVSDDALRAA